MPCKPSRSSTRDVRVTASGPHNPSSPPWNIMSVSVRGLHSAAPGSLFRSADSVARQPRLTCLRFRLISGLKRTRSAPGRRSRATTGWGSGRRSAPEPPCTRKRQSKTIGGCRPGNACLRQPIGRPTPGGQLPPTPGGPRRSPDGRWRNRRRRSHRRDHSHRHPAGRGSPGRRRGSEPKRT